MNRIKNADLKLGMRFSSPVFFDDGKNMFLAEKKPLSQFHMDSLKNWDIDELVTHGSLLAEDYVDEPEELLEELADFDDLIDEEESKNISSTINQYVFSQLSISENPLFIEYQNLIEQVAALFSSLINSKESNLTDKAEQITNEIINLVNKDTNTVLSFILLGENTLSYLEKSAINTAILTYTIAKRLNAPADSLQEFTQGALLHDIGMLQLPRNLLDKKVALSEEEFSEIKLHTINGFILLTESLQFPKSLSEITLHHHERFDGSGYPSTKQGKQIPLGAAIVSVADAFEAMVSHRPYRNSMLGSEAMTFLVSNSGRYYDPAIVEAFVQSMGIYPVGSTVLLNTGQFAHVIEVNPSIPLRPKIKIISSDSASSSEGIPIPPDQQKKIFIVRSLDPKEIEGAKK
ncbi:MAG: HD-GYP domain-containing protein [Treponemataceae bacterium]